MFKSLLLVMDGVPNEYGAAFVGWFDGNIATALGISVNNPFFVKLDVETIDIWLSTLHLKKVKREVN